MFAVKKILTSLILPPGIFVLLALLFGYWQLRRRNNFGYLNLALAVLIYFLSITPVAESLMGPLEKNWPIPRKVKGDVIVVLGSGMISGVKDASGQGFPTGVTLSRLVTAVRLHRYTGAPLIFSGGTVFGGTDSGAAVAKRILMDLGVPAEQIIIEDRSRDTIENARFVAKILEKGKWRQPILVTSASHMTRSVGAFRIAGIKVTPYPADSQVAPQRTYDYSDFLPSAQSLTRSALALHEYLGRLFYKLAY